MFNKLQKKYRASSPGCPMDKPIHQSVGPRESCGDKDQKKNLLHLNLCLCTPVLSPGRFAAQSFSYRAAIQAPSLACASLLSSPCFVPFIPSWASTPQQTPSVWSKRPPPKYSFFPAPCVRRHSSIKVSTYEVHFSLLTCVCKHLSFYEEQVCRLCPLLFMHVFAFHCVYELLEEWA